MSQSGPESAAADAPRDADLTGNRRKVLTYSIGIMASLAALVVALTIYGLYDAAFEQTRRNLVETAAAQARLIKAVAEYDATQVGPLRQAEAKQATLGQIRAAHDGFQGIGETGEFVLADLDGPDMRFILTRRFGGERRIPFEGSGSAEPMRRALNNERGSIVARDYRNKLVLAAYRPIEALGLGIVRKIDLEEIRAPYITAGIFAAVIAILLVSIGGLLMVKLSNPLIKRVEEQTAEARELRAAAEQANRAKSDFLSNMSHELRTPLNGVLGYAQILRRDQSVTDTQRSNLEAIESCGQHLLTLINDVLDLSKIEAGRLELDEGPADLARSLDGVIAIVRPRAEAKGLEIALRVAPEVPAGIITDSRKLVQVLVNLLGNAVKFTETGQVTLSVAENADGQLAFEVRDTGVGMAPEETAGHLRSLQAGARRTRLRRDRPRPRDQQAHDRSPRRISECDQPPRRRKLLHRFHPARRDG